jgi:hypothetical protein
MGSNNNKKSGNDPRGRVQDEVARQTTRYESQQGPMVNEFAHNYGRGSEANYGDYTDIMNQYRNIASGGGSSYDAGGGGGGGGGGYSAFTVSPGRASYSDPFNSYAGMKEFSETGGYSTNDIANMRARGVSPIRAAYANAEREMGRQRSLQGGYSPNAIAAQVKMAREQGQGAADATQNVEAGLAEARNKGRQFGLSGMSNIEGQRLGADVDISKFNTGLDFQGQTYNADAQARAQAQNNAAGEAAAGRAAANAAADDRTRLAALSGMTNLYGTTPGMAQLFGNQLLQGVGQGGTMGVNFANALNSSQQLPGQWDQTMGRISNGMDIANSVGNAIYPWLNRPKQPTSGGGSGGGGGYNPAGSGGGINLFGD